jgi:nucleotide-binding universal stress UspA family protein
MYYNVSVLLDGSEAAEVILQYVPSFVCSSGAGQITLLRVSDDAVESNSYLSKQADRIRNSWHLESCSAPPVDIKTLKSGPHDVSESIAGFAAGNDTGAIMLVTGGSSGLDWWRTGSMAQQLVRASPVPIYMARLGSGRHPRPGTIRRILVPLDGSLLSERALPFAEQIADNASADISLLSIPDSSTSHSSLEAFGTSFTETDISKYLSVISDNVKESVENVSTIIREGPPGLKIAEIAQDEKFDLIVMSSHGHTGPGRGAFGGVTESVLHGCHVPVLVIPPHLNTPEMREDDQ